MSLSCQNLLLAACLTVSIAANGQSSMDDLAGRFVKYVRADRKEKLLLLTDKPFYEAGENIWLKAWCLDSLSNRFIYLSKNLFVDLVDDKDSVVSQLLFNIPARRTSGKMLLPASLPEGYYWLRAYTYKILKEDSGRMFVKPVYIVNPNKPNPRALGAYVTKDAAPQAGDTAAPQLSFFPEGGSIISGATATVAFRSSSSDGRPVEISGYVSDPVHDTVTRFSSSQGMGKFSFDAYNPRKYTAHVKWRGRDVRYPLPLIDQFAYQLTVVSRDEHVLKLQVAQGDSLYKKHKQSKILGISRDSLCFGALGTDMYQVNVPLVNFPSGKASFLLFDDQDRLVSQRNIYIGADSGRIVATTDKSDYSPGDKVNLSIGVRSLNPAVTTFLTLAVTDDRLTGDHDGGSSATEGLTPAADVSLKGYSAADRDMVMLSQPSSYPNWGTGAGANAGRTVVPLADTNLLNIRGTVVNKNNEPLQKHIVNLVSGDNRFFLADTTDMKGHFVFPLSEYDDGTKFNMKLTDLKGRGTEGKMILEKIDYPQFNTPRALKKGFSSDELAMVRRYRSAQAALDQPVVKDSTMLKPVTVEGRKKLPDYDEVKRASPFSDVIGPDQLRKGGVDEVYNALSNVPGLTTGINRNASGGTMNVDPFYILLNGVPVNTGGDLKSFLESLDATNIEFIEVLKGPLTAIYGMQASGGVILINSVDKTRDVAQINSQGLATIYPKGYCNQADVFASGYDKKKGAAAATGQVSTLYWNANIPTDTRGNARVDFFTGARQATYLAAIVGVTPAGDIVETKIRIKCR
jgi:hypothetical protein